MISHRFQELLVEQEIAKLEQVNRDAWKFYGAADSLPRRRRKLWWRP